MEKTEKILNFFTVDMFQSPKLLGKKLVSLFPTNSTPKELKNVGPRGLFLSTWSRNLVFLKTHVASPWPTRSEESKFCNRNGIRGLDGGQAGPEIMSISISVNFQTCAITLF